MTYPPRPPSQPTLMRYGKARNQHLILAIMCNVLRMNGGYLMVPLLYQVMPLRGPRSIGGGGGRAGDEGVSSFIHLAPQNLLALSPMKPKPLTESGTLWAWVSVDGCSPTQDIDEAGGVPVTGKGDSRRIGLRFLTFCAGRKADGSRPFVRRLTYRTYPRRGVCPISVTRCAFPQGVAGVPYARADGRFLMPVEQTPDQGGGPLRRAAGCGQRVRCSGRYGRGPASAPRGRVISGIDAKRGSSRRRGVRCTSSARRGQGVGRLRVSTGGPRRLERGGCYFPRASGIACAVPCRRRLALVQGTYTKAERKQSESDTPSKTQSYFKCNQIALT